MEYLAWPIAAVAFAVRGFPRASQLCWPSRRLYLYTPGTELFYSRLGWSLVERTRYRGTDVVVMSYECAA